MSGSMEKDQPTEFGPLIVSRVTIDKFTRREPGLERRFRESTMEISYTDLEPRVFLGTNSETHTRTFSGIEMNSNGKRYLFNNGVFTRYEPTIDLESHSSVLTKSMSLEEISYFLSCIRLELAKSSGNTLLDEQLKIAEEKYKELQASAGTPPQTI